MRQTLHFLDNAIATGKLGSGPAEYPKSTNLLVSLWHSLPAKLLLIQLIWSSLITVAAYFLGRQTNDDISTTLSKQLWTTRLSVSPSVSYGVGWALFVLLGFFIREASARYHEAQVTIHHLGGKLRLLLRTIRQNYPRGTWHRGDYERIVAHIAAYPIVLKMVLRNEREAAQLTPFLDERDVNDIVNAPNMHVHCTRVIRAYLVSTESDAKFPFQFSDTATAPGGESIRFYAFNIVDYLDISASVAVRIACSQPAVGYNNHLYIFLYIWMMFLPLALVISSGWFTILWALLITYGIGMLFTIAQALNEPYGFDPQDVKLNVLTADISKHVILDFLNTKVDAKELLDKHHDTPTWMEASQSKPLLEYDFSPAPKQSFVKSFISYFKNTKIRPLRPLATICVILFTLWSVFIVFLTWGLRNDEMREASTRWWTLYLPLSTGTTGYVSLGVFLILGFWVMNAYSRYWQGLSLWQTKIRPLAEDLVTTFSVCFAPGTWYPRDHERIFSHLVALVYTAKAKLQGSSDFSELEGILAPSDLQALNKAPDPFRHVATVLQAHMYAVDAADPAVCSLKEAPWTVSGESLVFPLEGIEDAVNACEAIQLFPISPSFTIHLRLFTIFWLALLPLTLVLHDGFISFVFLIPISYSIINLLIIGDELSDPFGRDLHDIPLDLFYEEIKNTIHKGYLRMREVDSLVHPSEYSREKFKPKTLTMSTLLTSTDNATASSNVDQAISGGEEPALTLRDTFKKFGQLLPTVSLIKMIGVTLWAVAIVFVSWVLSRTVWDDGRNEKPGSGWSSPIDVEGSVLANVGFALFMILAFRASDALSRYDEGAETIYELENQLRHLTLTLVQAMKQLSLHANERERIVAHMVQIPLCLRDILLGMKRKPSEMVGLLSDDDLKAMEDSGAPLNHLLDTIESYILFVDIYDGERAIVPKEKLWVPGLLLKNQYRMRSIRENIAKILSVKRFPVVGSYTSHQYLFTVLWLVLLPLSMTNKTGFFSILWTTLIAYGVFALEEIAAKLVDPFGHDSIDIPVDQLCSTMSNSILEAVFSVRWGTEYPTEASKLNTEPRLGVQISGRNVMDAKTLDCYDWARKDADLNSVLVQATSTSEAHDEDGELNESKITVETYSKASRDSTPMPRRKKIVPTLYAHMVRSVPWWNLLAIIVWSTLACFISYLSRKRNLDGTVRWWVSTISVDVSVGTYISIGTLTLLGFYVDAAFQRYSAAGNIWGDKLRGACHSITRFALSVMPDGKFHEGDHARILGHIAAIPLVLKAELRGSKDIRETRGFLSNEDLGRIQSANSMVTHCVDVIRSYLIRVLVYPETLRGEKPGYHNPKLRCVYMRWEVESVESAIRAATFLNVFEIAPGFLRLLNVLLVLWFAILPFVLAELSGWFTILWMTLIGYGLLGMYQIAKEIQHPFGTDLNDFDLDHMADSIVADIVYISKEQKTGWRALIPRRPFTDMWTAERMNANGVSTSLEQISSSKSNRPGKSLVGIEAKYALEASDSMTMVQKLRRFWQLSSSAVHWTILLTVVVWSALTVSLSYLLSKKWPFPIEVVGNDCTLWFCAKITLDSAVMEYIGFALFLLLGFRLYDSHWRYVRALVIWLDGIKTRIHIVSAYMFGSLDHGALHEGDLERIAGHLAAYPICLMGSLRGLDYQEKLLRVLSEDDVNDILASKERADHCKDVVCAYLIEDERIMREGNGSPAGGNQNWLMSWHLRHMEDFALTCQEMVRIPLPFGYVQHLRIFLCIWLLLLPLSLVESSGWLTILWVVFITYGVVGIETWASHLSNPFGFDISDVPLEDLSDGITETVRQNMEVFRFGLRRQIAPEHSGFQEEKKDHALDL